MRKLALFAIGCCLLDPTAGLAQDSVPTRGDCDSSQTVTFLLRQNFSDIQLFDCASKVATAKGAEFSWSNDRVARDEAWTVNGMAAVAVSVRGDLSENTGRIGFMGATLAPYVQLNRETHSANTQKNTDTTIYGVSLEVGLDASALGRHYLRTSLSGVDDQIKNTNFFHAKFEWIPANKAICVGTACGVFASEQLSASPGMPQLMYRFSPEFKIQYDNALESSKPILFSGKDQSMRIGPEINFLTWFFYKEGGPIPDLWRKRTKPQSWP